MFRDFLAGVCLSAAMALLALGFSSTKTGEEFEQMVHRFLQRRLSPADSLPITIVDIGNLKAVGVTPREPLKRLVASLEKYDPKAVAIDIDFSPESGKFITAGDPAFFAYCLGLRFPVYLGISRTQALPPDEWLGLPEYKNLAASLLVPRDARRLARSLGPSKAPTISARLAGAYGEAPGRQNLEWLVERVSTKELGADVTSEESLVDYSMAQRLKDSSVRIGSDSFADGKKLDAILGARQADLRGKMVLIGDMIVNEDVFDSPFGAGSTPGVLLHASAAYTAVANPLYDIREPWRQLADFLIAVALLLCILAARIWFRESVNEERLFRLLTVGAVAIVIAAAGMVDATRIVWDDFLLVAIALALHPFADKKFEALREWLASWLQSGREVKNP